MNFIFTDCSKQPGVKYDLLSKFGKATLKGSNKTNPECTFLLPSDDDNSIHFYDSANNALKKVDLQNKSIDEIAIDRLHLSDLLAAMFVEYAPQQKALFLVKQRPRLFEASVSVALFVEDQWTRKQQPLHLDMSKFKFLQIDFDPDYFFSAISMSAIHKNKVLCSVPSATQLEVLAVDSSGEARCLQPLSLGFSHLCFTTGHSESTELLVVSVHTSNEVRVMAVADEENRLVATLLLRVSGIGGDKLLWRAGLLYSAQSNNESKSHEVNVCYVNIRGRRFERCGTPITRDDNMDIRCWSAVGEKIVLFDRKSENLIAYEVN